MNKIFKKGFNHRNWILFFDSMSNFLTVFGAIIVLIIFALFGLNTAEFISFFICLFIGGSKLIISIIKFINEYFIWNN